MKSRRTKTSLFDTINLEGGLISSAMLAQIADRKAGNQTEADYGIPKGLTLRDEIARYFRIAAALFKDFTASPNPSPESTVGFMQTLLRDVFGFSDVEKESGTESVVLSAKQRRVPVVVVPPADGLDRASAYLSREGRRRSASSALQDWLNHHEEALWGFCTNGETVRLMRDNATLTRPAYVEVNLSEIFEGENFADFAAAWLSLHATRFGAAGAPITECHLEHYREAGAKEGLVARDRLRDGVEAAILVLGNGFLGHSDNANLRARITRAELPLPVFFGQLLRLVYRMIFLLVAEDRGLLHSPDASPAACKLYAEGYSLTALRERSVRRTAWDRHYDRWEGLLITFQSLANGQPKLGLPALGGLFDNVIPDLEASRLSNKALMEAVYRLAWLKDAANLVPVNWRDMETEELGSVYESLLELTPMLVEQGRGFDFAKGDENKGNQRKTTGSYYTPDSLVQTLLDSALDPVLNRIESESADKVEGLLGIAVVDPACGSGHFLLAAARRIATRVARARTNAVASAADYRHALRDVVRSSIHGVDRNPMAVELTKVALWIETVEPGKPLGFLDANILLGDSLLGVYDLEILRAGIPDAAYKPLSGDDKIGAKYFDRRNKAERDGQGTFDFTGGRSSLPAPPPLDASLRAIRTLPEDTAAEISEKKRRLEASRAERERENWRIAADLYMAAFLLPKKEIPHESGASMVPTTDHVWRKLAGAQVYGPLIGATQEIRDQARLFHWPLEFADVFAKGGFDVVIGNPPWERVKLQEQEFFAAREPEIALAPTAHARGTMIEILQNAAPASRGRKLFQEFETAKRIAEASSVFIREKVRFPLTGVGDVNTYALFAELATLLAPGERRVGLILPTGIATDATTAPFFSEMVQKKRLIKLISFENEEFIFPAVHHSFRFCIFVLGQTEDTEPDFCFFLRSVHQLKESERHFSLSADEIAQINPTTKTAPVFRSRADARLTAGICRRVPVLIDESRNWNPWSASFHSRIWHTAEDSEHFRTESQLRETGWQWNAPTWTRAQSQGSPTAYVPLYEAKLIHLYDHRWATYEGEDVRAVELSEKHDPAFEPRPRYWVSREEVQCRLSTAGWGKEWLLGWRDITSGHVVRTLIADALPAFGSADTILLIFPGVEMAALISCLLGNLCSLVLDYCVRQKIGGTHLKFNVFKQLPVLPPPAYSQDARSLIVQRVLELIYTSTTMAPFARDLAYTGSPFTWDEDRRALLKSELDAWFARAYGLTRDELRYILDPTDVMGEDYPSETFRVLKNSEIKKYGEYRTRRLVLEAWDRLEAGDLR